MIDDLICEGAFTVTAVDIPDAAQGGGDSIAITIASKGFQATPRGLGFALGSVLAWYVQKVADRIPEAEREAAVPEMLATFFREVNGGILHALTAGEVTGREQ